MIPIYDCFDENYKKPFGAIERYSECVFTLRFPDDLIIEEPLLVVFRPGQKERFTKLEKIDVKDGFAVYSCSYTPADLGLHFYYFSLLINRNRHYIKKNGASEGVIDNGDLFQLTVYKEGMTTPDWIKGGIMYQIFPDRFAKSGAPHNDVPYDRKIHTNWNDTPDWRPDSRGQITNSDYFGGDLKGIQEKLGYLAELGVTVIYLNPIFEAQENHRYCTSDYSKIDPLLGTEEDFVNLCKAAKEKGISIILDGVFSHTGADSIYFNKTGRYGDNVGAYRDPESPYREWYSFSNYPDVYESWWGITTLPNVNENNPAYTNYICGDGGILQKWIDLGAAGWRLDVADELPDEFIDNLNKAVKAKGDDKIIYGEVWEDASNKESYGVRRRYLTGGQLDSVMNYPFKEAILNYCKYADPRAFRDSILTILDHYPKPAIDMLMNFLSTHDTERALTRLGGEEIGWHDKDWQCEKYLDGQQYMYGISLMKCAMVLQFFLPGIPSVYYGDEAGMEGYRDPFNRRCYPWGRENLDLIEFTRQLSVVRKGTRAFEQGHFEFIEVTDDVVVFARYDKITRDAAIVYLNKSTRGHTFTIKNEHTDMFFDFVPAFDRYGRGIKDGTITVSPFDYAVIYCKV